MNYQKIYDQIIEKRKLEEPEGYTEVHHIIPRSLDGDDTPENLVRLTTREHFICHYLLVKMHEKESFEWYKMNHAFMMMKCTSITQNRYFNSRLYEALKGNRSSIMSYVQSGKNNNQYGTMWICNIELRENRKIKKDDIIPNGWVKGRNAWKRKDYFCEKCGILLTSSKKYCKSCYESVNLINLKNNTTNIRQEKLKLANQLYEYFINNNFNSISEFCRSDFTDIKYPGTLLNLWKRNIPDKLKELQKRNYKPL